jgi:hypothetical protein
MSYKGNLINDKYVLFGSVLNEKTKQAINNGCPSGADIIRSLPESATLLVPEEVVVKKEAPPKVKINRRKERLKRKKALAKKKEMPPTAKKAVPTKEPITTIEKIIQEKEPMSLDQELDSLIEEVKPKEEVPAVEPEVVTQQDSSDNMRSQILSFLANDPDTPSLEEIDEWKEKFGQNGIHVMSFGDTDNYIYHHLTRGEWKKIKDVMKRLRDSENADELEEKLKEKVVCNCVLWPEASAEWLETSKAGVVDSLYQMILLNSGFLTPQQAMLLTTQL